jgi:uncharacterized membrane protein
MKPWYQSRTLWAAVLTGIIGVATVVVSDELVSKDMAGVIIVGIAVVSSILRTLTTKPLGV